MAAVYDDLLRDSVLLRKDLEYALVGCNDKQVGGPPVFDRHDHNWMFLQPLGLQSSGAGP